MKSKSIILIAIALGCGLVASIGISQVMGRSQKTETLEAPKLETATLVVALSDLDIGETFSTKNVKLEKWPKENAPEGAVAEFEALKGKFPRVRVTKGQPIMQSMLMDSLDKKIIPEGYRVIPIKVAAETVSGLVLPGDRVDVLILLRAGREINRTMVRTVLKDVRIFDVNSKTERILEEGKTTNVKTVSLLLTPSKVELMTLAMEMGKLRLSLRRHNDTKSDNYDGAEMSELLGTAAQDGSPKKDNSFEDLVDARQAMPIAPIKLEPVHEMELITPGGITAYTWTDINKPPTATEIGKGSSAPSTPVLDIPALGPEAAIGGTPDSTVNRDENVADDNTQPNGVEAIKFEE
jgi:pilus assembly protein CpaB